VFFFFVYIFFINKVEVHKNIHKQSRGTQKYINKVEVHKNINKQRRGTQKKKKKEEEHKKK
jgi:transcription initiation factor IIF auxiliary subunit